MYVATHRCFLQVVVAQPDDVPPLVTASQTNELGEILVIEVLGDPLPCYAGTLTALVNVVLRGGLSKLSHVTSALLSMSIRCSSSGRSAWGYGLGVGL